MFTTMRENTSTLSFDPRLLGLNGSSSLGLVGEVGATGLAVGVKEGLLAERDGASALAEVGADILDCQLSETM